MMELRNLAYNDWHDVIEEDSVMSRRKVQLKEEESFGSADEVTQGCGVFSTGACR